MTEVVGDKGSVDLIQRFGIEVRRLFAGQNADRDIRKKVARIGMVSFVAFKFIVDYFPDKYAELFALGEKIDGYLSLGRIVRHFEFQRFHDRGIVLLRGLAHDFQLVFG